MGEVNNRDTKLSWFDDNSAFQLPARRVTWQRVSLHVLFWSWDFYSALNAFDRLLRVDPAVPPDPGLFYFMLTGHLATTFIIFYWYGYFVVPTLMNVLVYMRTTGRYAWQKTLYVVGASLLVFTFYNIYDYYLFSYAASHFKPVAPYVTKWSVTLGDVGPFGIYKRFSIHTFIWAFNISYVLLPLLLRMVREAISWGVVSVEQREQNQQLIQNQLQMLQYQINPHFLFNVFNNIYALIQKTNIQAARLLKRLSQLMHYTLYETKELFVPLPGEIQFLVDYVEMEQSRHFNPDSIQFDRSGQDRDFLIPPLLLVTFVENAFKHGLNAAFDAGWVTIKLLVDETGRLHLEVANSKPAAVNTPNKAGGLGLQNARRRLSALFPDSDYSLVVDEQNEYYRVVLTLLLKQSPVHEHQATR